MREDSEGGQRGNVKISGFTDRTVRIILGNLLRTEKRLTELDIADRHYQNKVDSLNRILDDLYEKIEHAQTRLGEVNQEITMAESKATYEEIKRYCFGFFSA